MIKLAMHWQILIALILGVLFGCFCWGQIGYIAWMADIFIRLLNMIVIPLIFFILVTSLTEVAGSGSIGRLGLKTMLFYMVTTLLAIATGILLTRYFQPGAGVDIATTQALPDMLTKVEKMSFSQMLIQIVPKNIFEAMTSGNMLQIVFFALFTGFFVAKMKDAHGTFLKNFFEAGTKLTMNMTLFIIKLAPYGVFAIIACRIAEFGGDSDRLLAVTQSIGKFFSVVAGGLAFHLFVTLSLILLLFRINPLAHLRNMFVPLTTAFSTATTNVTIPLSLQALQEKEGVSNRIASFTIPLGATLNMNGTALYECVIVFFIAQVYNIELSLAQMFLVTVMVLLTAMGTPGIPMASLVMIAIILNAVGLPVEGIGLVLVTDRILDMCRTTVNVYGDTCCAVCIAKSEGEQLKV